MYALVRIWKALVNTASKLESPRELEQLMIDMELASAIWHCHREIAAAEELLKKIEEEEKRLERDQDARPATLRDAFGRRRVLQLGIPSGESGHRLFDVATELAKSVIRAHAANKQAELVRLNEQAWIAIESQRCARHASKPSNQNITIQEAGNGSA